MYILKSKILKQQPYLTCLKEKVNPGNTVFAFDLHNVIFKKVLREIIIKSFKILPRGPWWYAFNPIFWKNLYKIISISNVGEDIFDKLSVIYPTLSPFKNDFISLVNAQLPINSSLKLLQKLKERGYKLYILSNIGFETLKELEKKYPEIISCFDGAYIPSIENEYRHKPDQLFFKEFKAYLDQIGHGNKQILFIDDLRRNLSSALKCDIAGIYCKSIKAVTEILKVLEII